MKKKLLLLLLIWGMILPFSLNLQAQVDEYTQRFLDLYEKINDPNNGYFSADGVPYHSVETLICEAPDYGHESTSEMFSYWIWLEAMYGKITGDWSSLGSAWDKLEFASIPTQDLQPTAGSYNPNSPATYAAEHPQPSGYPSPLESGVPVGQDPVSGELTSTYGDSYVYGMHWLFDLDNFYGYGRKGDGVSTPSYINTFQRGEQESVWETVPHPSWEDFSWGADNGTGFLSLFIAEDAAPAAQWRYTNAPDADARAVQAIYWASEFAKEQGLNPASVLPVEEAKKMGDYLRLAMFDKYFKPMGVEDKNAPGATGYESAHYLMSWYYAWGGPLESQGWAWRIGCSHNHFGYQNPVAAYALSAVPELIPNSPNAERDWGTSLDRQLEFYQWLQSAEGAIAGGATNSWNGDYDPYPAGRSTFYGMAYDDHPVYHDPGSNTWFGWQAWSMERVAEYYYITNDSRAQQVISRWIDWVLDEVVLTADGSYEIPVELSWSGQPDNWDPANPGSNASLHVNIEAYNQDVGIAACLSKALIYYAAATERYATLDTEARDLAKELLDRMWENYYDPNGKGCAVVETRGDYTRFFEQEVFIPDGWTGTMANGDVIEPGVTFIDIRSGYRDDPDWPALEAAYAAGEDYEKKYHRFWAQADIAMANAEYARFFIDDGGDPVPVDGVSVTPSSDAINTGETLQLTATVSPVNATNKSVTWSTSDAGIATVNSSGLVTGVDEGVASITATTNDGGFEAVSVVTVTDTPVDYYTLSTNVVGQGTISLSPAGGSYEAGTEVTLNATAAAGSQFVGWSGDVSGSSASVSLIMDGDKSVTATFETADQGDCSPRTMPFSTDGVISTCYTVTGSVNYINSWNMALVEVNGVDFTNQWSNNLPAGPNGEYEIRLEASVPWAHFEIDGTSGQQPTYYDLTTSIVGEGTISPQGGSYEEGSAVTLTATPAAGYIFSGWSGDASGTSSTVSINMDSDKSVTATFIVDDTEPVTFDLSVNVIGQGSVVPEGGSYEEGTSVTLTATPASGYIFSGWSGDASGSSPTLTVLMDADKAVTATFTEDQQPVFYELTTSVTGQGSVTPSGGSFEEGTVVSITATAASGFVFDSWSGDASGTSSATNITMDGNKTVVANFIEDTPPEGCDNPVAIDIPFVYNGAGEFCWVTTTEIAYINSWNLDLLEINGVDFTNTWSNNLPPAVNGEWVIHYIGPYAWSHFEAPQAKAAIGISSDNDFEVYPNPFEDELHINLGNLENVTKIELLNSLGQVVEQLEADQLNSGVITITTEETGNLFILRVHTDSDIYVKSVVKQ